MENLGDFNVTLSPADSFEEQPVNLNETVTVDRDTPLGALNATSDTECLNYTVWYSMMDGQLEVNSINGTTTTYEWYWVAYYEESEGEYAYEFNTTNHVLSDGETFWFIYIKPDSNNTFERDIATATYGLSITATCQNQSIVDIIGQNENLTTLAYLIGEANLNETLSAGGPYTVFAPDDMVFDDLGFEAIAGLMDNASELTRILTYHVVEGDYSSEELLNMTGSGNETTLESLAGEDLILNRTEGGELTVNGAMVVTPDIRADNGVIHVIDAVLTPSYTNET